jgi:HEAT repeat protein
VGVFDRTTARDETPASPAGIEDLVGRLADLHETDRVAVQILAAGRAAVPTVARFLLDGPSLHPGPRRTAAEILGNLGGDEALVGLVEGLRLLDREIASPVVRLSEEAVSDAVAEALSRFPPALVVFPLRAAFRRHRLVGAAEALAAVGDEGVLEDVARALEDDFKRWRLLDVLRRFGTSAEVAVNRVLAECDSLPDSVLLRKRQAACRRFLDGRSVFHGEGS